MTDAAETQPATPGKKQTQKANAERGGKDVGGRPKGTTKTSIDAVAKMVELGQQVLARAGRATNGNKPVDPTSADFITDPAEFLRARMNDPRLDMKLRMQAANRLLSLETAKGKKGKKEQKADAAREVADGAGGRSKFGSTAPPPLKRVA